jgi:hypothetical protein
MAAALWAGGGLSAQERNFTARFTDCPPPCVQFTNASFEPRVTPNGMFVVFTTAQIIPGIMPPPPAGVRQVYRLNRFTSPPEVLLVSRVGTEADGAPAERSCFRPSISNDGNRVVYGTLADMLTGNDTADSNFLPDVYLRDLTTNVTVRISERSDGEPNGNSNSASISGNGFYVAFTSTASNIATNAVGNPVPDANGNQADVFRALYQSGPFSTSIEIVSLNNDSPPAQSSFNLTKFRTGDTRVGRVISDDGQLIVFVGAPCDWDDGPGQCPVTVNCLCPQPDRDCAACLSGENSEINQVYLRDLNPPARTFRVSRLAISMTSFTAANNDCRDPVLNDDATMVAFSTFATNLPLDTDGQEDVFRISIIDITDFDNLMLMPAVNPLRISVPLGGAPSNGPSTRPMLSGPYVAFQSAASNLVSGDTNARTDVFLASVVDGTITLDRASVGVSGTGINLVQADNHSTNPDVGLFSAASTGAVVYESLATNLIAMDTNGIRDVFETRNLVFIRGDADGADASYDQQADGDFLLAFLFTGGPAPICMDAADFNDDGSLNISDVGTPPPLLPPSNCMPPNADLTIDQITCRSYPICGS